MVSRISLFIALGLLVAWPAEGADAPSQAQPQDSGQRINIDFNHPVYRDIQREEAQSADHIDGPIDYGTDFPTSGLMAATPSRAGFYNKPLPLESLVHSLEHGAIVVYYDKLSDDAEDLIRGWTDQYRGAMDAVIAVPNETLGETIVLTSWEYRLDLPKMDIRASFFVDAFRGRGPEGRIRLGGRPPARPSSKL